MRIVRACTGCESNPHRIADGWWKGNLHTHTLWSDGDDYPEMVVDWYKRNGYHFVALSDHDVLPEGSRWIRASTQKKGLSAFRLYKDRFDAVSVELAGQLIVRLKTLEEFRPLFEEADRFLIIQSEEISDNFESIDVHINATNIRELIPAQHGRTVGEVLQNNIDAVLEQRRRSGQAMIPHVSHPNLGWAITAGDIADLRGEKFFEVFNGHPGANSAGDRNHPATDVMWDEILVQRLTRGEDIIYGLAVDDAHHYREWHSTLTNPGRGWVMVRARPELTAESIVEALESGDFYSSTGVVLDDIVFDGTSIRIEIQAEPEILYETEFIGALRPGSAETSAESNGPARVTFAVSKSTSPTYKLTGDEIFVRARISSTRYMSSPARDIRHEMAWTQPVVPER
ncbi:MAG: histidinol-phosphatase [Rhodothermales bacterium]|nr:histidinol-phosphatase [Rhodothermales bacterium]